jgi:hypothetical protein
MMFVIQGNKSAAYYKKASDYYMQANSPEKAAEACVKSAK